MLSPYFIFSKDLLLLEFSPTTRRIPRKFLIEIIYCISLAAGDSSTPLTTGNSSSNNFSIKNSIFYTTLCDNSQTMAGYYVARL
jgi:hypothetical protein